MEKQVLEIKSYLYTKTQSLIVKTGMLIHCMYNKLFTT